MKHGCELSGFGPRPRPSQRLRCVLKTIAWRCLEGWATMLLLMLLLWLRVCFMYVKPCGLLDAHID